ncbi:unnamed protein product [Amoebophrya sp. A25]|nr:unnamed protein product [Amoebophrya sp. A25]|eukprot:GSA25T00012716001.1
MEDQPPTKKARLVSKQDKQTAEKSANGNTKPVKPSPRENDAAALKKKKENGHVAAGPGSKTKPGGADEDKKGDAVKKSASRTEQQPATNGKTAGTEKEKQTSSNATAAKKKDATATGDGKDGAPAKAASKVPVPKRTFFGEKKHFQYFRIPDELEKRTFRNERDAWPDFFAKQKDSFNSTCTTEAHVNSYCLEVVRAVVFDWIPVCCGIQMLLFLVEHEAQLKWTCNPLNDEMQPVMSGKKGDSPAFADEAETLEDLYKKGYVVGLSREDKLKCLSNVLLMMSQFLPAPVKNEAGKQLRDAFTANFDALAVALVRYRIFSRSELLFSIEAPEVLPEKIGPDKRKLVTRKNQLRTKEKFTHIRFNLLRENPSGYAEVLILMRQLLHAGAGPVTVQVDGIAHQIRRQLNEQILAGIRERREANPDLYSSPELDRSLEDVDAVLDLPKHLTEAEVVDQIHSLCGAQSLDLGRIASLILDHMGFILSRYRLPVEVLSYEISGAGGAASADQQAWYSNPVVRSVNVLARLLRRVVPRQRVAEVLQYRLGHVYREKIPLLEKDYAAKVQKYRDTTSKVDEAKQRWDKAKTDQTTAEDKERRERNHVSQRMHRAEQDRILRPLQNAVSQAQKDASSRLQEVMRYRTEQLEYWEEMSAARSTISRERSGIDFQLVAYLVHVGLLDADRIWSQLPATLWRSKELEGFCTLDPDYVGDENEKRHAEERMEDLAWLRNVLPGKLSAAHKAAVQHVHSIVQNPDKEHGYEKLCSQVNVMDSPQLRLLSGLLSINAWRRASSILQNIGRHAGMIHRVRGELVALVMWVLDPLIRQYALDPAWEEAAPTEYKPTSAGSKTAVAHYDCQWDKGTPVADNEHPRGYERLFQKFLRFDVSGRSPFPLAQPTDTAPTSPSGCVAENDDDVPVSPIMRSVKASFSVKGSPASSPNGKRGGAVVNGSDPDSTGVSQPESGNFHMDGLRDGAATEFAYAHLQPQAVPSCTRQFSGPSDWHLDQRVKRGVLPTSGQAYTIDELRLDGALPAPDGGHLVQCFHIRDFLTAIEPLLFYLDSSLHQEPRLLEVLWKLTQHYMADQQSSGALGVPPGHLPPGTTAGAGIVGDPGALSGVTSPGATTSSPAEPADPRILQLLTGVLLPAIAMTHTISESMVALMWQVLQTLPGVTRWKVYQDMLVLYEQKEPLPLMKARVSKKVQNALKRATGAASQGGAGGEGGSGGAPGASGGSGPAGGPGSSSGGGSSSSAAAAANDALAQTLQFHIARLSDSNPLIVYRTVVEQVAVAYNDNMIVPILALTKKLSYLAADAASFSCIQECFTRSLKGSLLSQGVNIEGWLQNLSKWISLFFAVHPDTDVSLVLQAVADFIEAHATKGLNADTFGNSLLQVIVTNLIANMGSWSYVTELSDSQLEILSGGVQLRTEQIYAKNAQFETNDTIARDARSQEILLRTLETTDVVRRFWRSLGLMRRASTSDDNLANVLQQMRGPAASHLKKVGYLYDQTHQCLMSITQFLGRSLRPRQYHSLLPQDINSIFNDFEPAFAYTMIRPALPAWHENVTDETFLLDSTVSWNTDIAGVSNSFRYAFWRLELGDISCPPQYDSCISAHDKVVKEVKEEIERLQLRASTSVTARDYLEQKKALRDERQDAKQHLKDERDGQLKRVHLTLQRIEREKNTWVLENSERTCKNLVSEFLAKRFLLSYDDALFCSYFTFLLVKTKTKGISATDLGQKIVDALSAKVDACTEDEARILGVFVANFLSSKAKTRACRSSTISPIPQRANANT